jgi:hypothetical protein
METSFCCGPARESLLRQPRDRTASGSYENFNSGAPCGRKPGTTSYSLRAGSQTYQSTPHKQPGGRSIDCILQQYVTTHKCIMHYQ